MTMFLFRVVGNGIPTNGIDSCGFQLSFDSESANLNLALRQVSSRRQGVSRACLLAFFSLYVASDSGIGNYKQIYSGPVREPEKWNKNQPEQNTRTTTKTYVRLNVYLYWASTRRDWLASILLPRGGPRRPRPKLNSSHCRESPRLSLPPESTRTST